MSGVDELIQVASAQISESANKSSRPSAWSGPTTEESPDTHQQVITITTAIFFRRNAERWQLEMSN